MGVLPVDMMKPIPQEPKPQEKPKPNENEIFHVPENKADDTNEIKPPQTQTEIENQPIPQVKAKKPRGKSDPEHLKKMREASALRRAERKREKEEAERVIAEAKLLKEQQLAQRMGGNPNNNSEFDYDKLAEAIERRKANKPKPVEPVPQRATQPVQNGIDYKKEYEKAQVKLFEERVRADERKRIKAERESKMKNVAANNLRVPKALQKYQERANQYAESNKSNPWDSFFK